MTPREICASYSTSILLRRWVGAWIDFVVIAAIYMLPIFALGKERYYAVFPIWILLVAAYFPVLECLTGKTVGKLVTSTVVVDAHGQKPGFLKAMIRTFFRLIEVNPLLLGGVPAGVAVLISKKRQRIGDMVAKTFVLKTEDLSKLGIPPRAE